MKFNLFLNVVFAVLLAALPAFAAKDVVEIKGTACEKFTDAQSRSSVRVRVTDKASFNAVSSIKDFANLRSQMLDHDFNVIVYNLVDNYVQDLAVRTVNQSPDELCVEVTGEIPSQDIVSVIANYSSVHPAPEYDFKKANNIKEEKLIFIEDELKSNKPKEPDAEVLYQKEVKIETIELPPEEEFYIEDAALFQPEPDIKIEETAERRTLIYIAPVEFYNNSHSTKPTEVLKDMFSNRDVYRLVDSQDQADYALFSKVLKAKIDPVNAHTKRLHMVVSMELKTAGSDASFTGHQNRFVLFDESEKEQDVAQALLRKLLRTAGEGLFKRIDATAGKKRSIMPVVITPTYVD